MFRWFLFVWVVFLPVSTVAEIVVCAVFEDPFTTLRNGSLGPDGFYDPSEVIGFDSDVEAEVLQKVMGLQYKKKMFHSYAEVVTETRYGRCDIGFAPFTPTVQRSKCGCPELDPHDSNPDFSLTECCVEFSQPYFPCAIGLITKRSEAPSTKVFISALESHAVVNPLIAILFTVIVGGNVIWALERHRNSTMYPLNYIDGVIGGMWWAAVTMTTVGYGDKSPRTQRGRFFSFFFMFTSITLFGILNASLTTFITQNLVLPGDKLSIDDLAEQTICTISQYVIFLENKNVKVIIEDIDTLQSCLRHLKAGEAAAILYDSPWLEYLLVADPDLTTKYAVGVDLLDVTLATVVPTNSTLIEALNQAIITVTNDQVFMSSTRAKWFGTVPVPAAIETAEYNTPLAVVVLILFLIVILGWTYEHAIRHSARSRLETALQRSMTMEATAVAVPVGDAPSDPVVIKQLQQLQETLESLQALATGNTEGTRKRGTSRENLSRNDPVARPVPTTEITDPGKVNKYESSRQMKQASDQDLTSKPTKFESSRKHESSRKLNKQSSAVDFELSQLPNQRASDIETKPMKHDSSQNLLTESKPAKHHHHHTKDKPKLIHEHTWPEPSPVLSRNVSNTGQPSSEEDPEAGELRDQQHVPNQTVSSREAMRQERREKRKRTGSDL